MAGSKTPKPPAAAQALESAGFSEPGVVFIGGEEALAVIDPEGREHGLLGRITRSLDTSAREGEAHYAAAAAVRAGHSLVMMSVLGGGEACASTLRGKGIPRLRYWGPLGDLGCSSRRGPLDGVGGRSDNASIRCDPATDIRRRRRSMRPSAEGKTLGMRGQ